MLSLRAPNHQCFLAYESMPFYGSFCRSWQTGIGAVVGLMGGKAADLLHKEEEGEDKDKQ
jgi:hypothetical protein